MILQQRGRWFSGRWEWFQRETRAVGHWGNVAGGRWGLFQHEKRVAGHRHDVAGRQVGGGGCFDAKRGRWDVAATWQVVQWVVAVVSTPNEGGGTLRRCGR